MIIHTYADGSRAYQYEIGDRVIVQRTIHGGWFDHGPTASERCVVIAVDAKSSWRIAEISVRYSEAWGPAKCFPWMVAPHTETLAAAVAKARKNREQAVFESWLREVKPAGDAEKVQDQWESSDEKAAFEDDEVCLMEPNASPAKIADPAVVSQ